jgi:hypothetical protein
MLELVKEIRSKDGTLHFRRWCLIDTRWFKVYIHGIYAEDKDTHMHNHPWDYFCLVLKGSYIEETKSGDNTMTPGTIVKRVGEDYHRIKKLLTSTVYALLIVTPMKRKWGYLVDGKWVNYETYRKSKNNLR